MDACLLPWYFISVSSLYCSISVSILEEKNNAANGKAIAVKKKVMIHILNMFPEFENILFQVNSSCKGILMEIKLNLKIEKKTNVITQPRIGAIKILSLNK
jgi:hypothetical protein